MMMAERIEVHINQAKIASIESFHFGVVHVSGRKRRMT